MERICLEEVLDRKKVFDYFDALRKGVIGRLRNNKIPEQKSL